MTAELRTDLLALNRKQGLNYFGFLLHSAGIENVGRIVQAAHDGITQNQAGELKNIERQWYNALDSGTPDYSVYDSDLYLAEVWMCWFMYPKKYLREMQKPRSLPPNGLLKSLSQVRTIVDLGNGLGVTSAALKSLFPNARVIGTNVAGSSQMRVGNLLAQIFDFEMVDDINAIKGPVDLVFASEYFEHFDTPLAHLSAIIREIQPHRWLIANTFGGDSIGHFDDYHVNSEMIHGSKMGRVWGDAMRGHGYEKVQTGMWNNRPSYFVEKTLPGDVPKHLVNERPTDEN